MRQKAMERLRQAQLELSYGKAAQARRWRGVVQGDYGIQEEAFKLIRSISARIQPANPRSEANVRCARDAFVRKDYRMAKAMFERLDPQMLPEEYKSRYREFMSSARCKGNQGRQRFHSRQADRPDDDAEASPNPAPETHLMAKRRAEDIVRYQALRQRGRGAANRERSVQEQSERDAMETLENYLKQVTMEDSTHRRRTTFAASRARIQQFRPCSRQKRSRESRTPRGSGTGTKQVSGGHQGPPGRNAGQDEDRFRLYKQKKYNDAEGRG